MTSKKWIVVFFATILLLIMLLALFNLLVDPFGVFGDPIFNWYSYNMTMNPRVAKIAYINRNHERFDSFIIGSSGTSAFPTDMLNEHFDASFFNMFMYGSDMLHVEQTVRYLIDNFTVENLVLSVYIDSAIYFDTQHNHRTLKMHARTTGGSRLSFYRRFLIMDPQYSMDKIRSFRQRTYLPQSFNVFDTSTGAYDKRARAAEPIGCMERYLEAYPIFANYPPGRRLMLELDNSIRSIERIRDMCEAAGINLMVIVFPVYHEHFARFYHCEVTEFFTRLADVVPFWDFSMSSVSFEPRYFYDATHFRGDVGAMALTRIFGGDLYVPPDFGVFVTSENAYEHVRSLFEVTPKDPALYTAKIPVLMFHHITDTVSSDVEITPEVFAMQMRALRDNGFTTITLRELVDYVDYGAPLPERPIIITFDDGYLSVYEHAFPVLERYGMRATVFVIGSAVGTSYYRDTGYPTIPKFCFEQARRMRGVICIQSHTYDMHQWAPLEPGRAREDILRWDDENEADYIEILREDHRLISAAIYRELGQEVFAVAFPHGVYDTLSTAVLQSVGVRVTFSTRRGVNTVIKGLPQSLLSLYRINVPDHMSTDRLLELIDSARG